MGTSGSLEIGILQCRFDGRSTCAEWNAKPHRSRTVALDRPIYELSVVAFDQAPPHTISRQIVAAQSLSRLAKVINTEFNGYLNLLLLFPWARFALLWTLAHAFADEFPTPPRNRGEKADHSPLFSGLADRDLPILIAVRWKPLLIHLGIGSSQLFQSVCPPFRPQFPSKDMVGCTVSQVSEFSVISSRQGVRNRTQFLVLLLRHLCRIGYNTYLPSPCGGVQMQEGCAHLSGVLSAIVYFIRSFLRHSHNEFVFRINTAYLLAGAASPTRSLTLKDIFPAFCSASTITRSP